MRRLGRDLIASIRGQLYRVDSGFAATIAPKSC